MDGDENDDGGENLAFFRGRGGSSSHNKGKLAEIVLKCALSWRKKGYAMPKSRRQYNNSSRCIVSFALDLTLPLSVVLAAAASHGRGGCGGGGGSAPREGAHEAGHGLYVDPVGKQI